MTVYLASPGTQQQADYLKEMPVLLSFAHWSDWMDRYTHSFRRILIDSGAFSVMNSGKPVAGLDDITGDWRTSLKNYQKVGFPTIHDTDPRELLSDLIQLAQGTYLSIKA